MACEPPLMGSRKGANSSSSSSPSSSQRTEISISGKLFNFSNFLIHYAFLFYAGISESVIAEPIIRFKSEVHVY